jgi:hypothetical protein
MNIINCKPGRDELRQKFTEAANYKGFIKTKGKIVFQLRYGITGKQAYTRAPAYQFKNLFNISSKS